MRPRYGFMPLAVVVAGLLLVGWADGASVVEVEFWSPFGTGTGAEALNALVAEFNATHPTIKVNHRGRTDDLAQAYKVALAGGVPPDIAWEAPEWFSDMYTEEVLVPIETLATRDGHDTSSIWPGVWGTALDGRQWGYPFEIGSEAMIYNQDRFEEAGIARAPATWDEYLVMAKKLSNPEQSEFGIHPGYANYITVQWIWRNKGRLVSPDLTVATLTDPRTVDALQWYCDLETKHLVVGGSLESGTAASIVVHSGWYAHVQRLHFAAGTAPTPIPVDGERVSLSYYKELVIFRTTNAREEAAWTFIKWLMDPQRQAEWAIATGYLPISRDVLGTGKYRAYLQQNPGLMPWIDELNYIRNFPASEAYNRILGLFDQAIGQVRGGMPALTALTALQTSAQAILDESR